MKKFMTANDYFEQNKLGFEGDKYLGLEIKDLVDNFKIDHIIETGTYLGYTTIKLADLAPVSTVEINPAFHTKAQSTFNLSKYREQINSALGNSVDYLKLWIPALGKEKNLLFFLDAHWQDYCPLIDELKVIAENKIKPVIVIHDFKVPEHPELGFDSYRGQDYEWPWIKEHIVAIYGKEYSYHYNSRAEGARRGVIFIYPTNEH